MKNFHNQSVKEILADLNTSITSGLTAEEVGKRLEEYGYNILEEKRNKSFV